MGNKTNSKDSAQSVRSQALQILARVEDGAWSDRLLQARESTMRDPRDRRFLHLLVLTTLRWQLAIDPLLEPLVKGPLSGLRPLVRAALRMGVCEASILERPVAIAVSTAVSAIKPLESARAAGLVNAVLRRALKDGPPALNPAKTVPGWLLTRWRANFGEQRTRSLAASTTEPCLPFLVALQAAGGREVIRSKLEEEGVLTELSLRHPAGLRVIQGAPQLSTAFKEGGFILLDEAAALVARLAAPPPDGLVLDMTASPGLKAALIAENVHTGLAAMELVEGRARQLQDNLHRFTEREKTAALRADAQIPPFAPGSFSLVLLDAPCSGTGTLGARPEKRLRLRGRDIRRCTRLQKSLLGSAAELVCPGGRLVYAVCSIEPEEGRLQIESFLERYPQFEIEDPRGLLGEENGDLIEGTPPILRILPDMGPIDGFSAARMRRRSPGDRSRV